MSCKNDKTKKFVIQFFHAFNIEVPFMYQIKVSTVSHNVLYMVYILVLHFLWGDVHVLDGCVQAEYTHMHKPAYSFPLT